jgi:hypothetical protein
MRPIDCSHAQVEIRRRLRRERRAQSNGGPTVH